MIMESLEAPVIKGSKKTKSQILALWKKGRNIWEISQLTGASEVVVSEVVNDRL